jgi:hypothetical protein
MAHCMILMYMDIVYGGHTIWYMMYLVDVLFMIIYFIFDIYFLPWYGMSFNAWTCPRIIIESVVVL